MSVKTPIIQTSVDNFMVNWCILQDLISQGYETEDYLLLSCSEEQKEDVQKLAEVMKKDKTFLNPIMYGVYAVYIDTYQGELSEDEPPPDKPVKERNPLPPGFTRPPGVKNDPWELAYKRADSNIRRRKDETYTQGMRAADLKNGTCRVEAERKWVDYYCVDFDELAQRAGRK